MNLLDKLGLVTKKDLRVATDLAKQSQKVKMENLVAENKKLKKDNDNLKEKSADMQVRIDALEERVDESRELVRKEIELSDKEVILEALKEGIDKKEAKLKERAARLEDDETSKYQEGYADGVADGLRKAHEITEKDRENAMKVAMVAAGSHSQPGMIQEATDALQLTAGSN